MLSKPSLIIMKNILTETDINNPALTLHLNVKNSHFIRTLVS